MDRIGVVVAAEFAGNVGLARQRQRLGAEGGFERLIAGGFQKGRDERRIAGDFLAVTRVARRLHQVRKGKVGQRLPAGEEIGVVAGDMGKIGRRLVEMQVDRRRERTVERQDRAGGNAREGEGLPALGQMQHVAGDFATRDLGWHCRRAVVEDEREGERDVHRFLGRLAGSCRDHLLER
jgi:hypothetical protein